MILEQDFGLLRHVVWWLETDVSEAVLPPSSGLKFVIVEMLNELCFWTLSIVWCLKNKQKL
jgi:hypothetical protein